MKATIKPVTSSASNSLVKGFSETSTECWEVVDSFDNILTKGSYPQCIDYCKIMNYEYTTLK